MSLCPQSGQTVLIMVSSTLGSCPECGAPIEAEAIGDGDWAVKDHEAPEPEEVS